MSLAMVGGKERFDFELQRDVGETKTITQIGREVDQMRAPKKAFRQWRHYASVCWRWSTVAIATAQWDMASALAHQNIVSRMAEVAQWKYGAAAMFIAFLYCELRRRSWAKKCRKGEIKNIQELREEAATEDEATLRNARQGAQRSQGEGVSRQGLRCEACSHGWAIAGTTTTTTFEIDVG